MKLKPIIESLLETDLYKFSMGQAIYHQFPGYKTTWTFKCRNTDVHFTEEMVEEIREQIKSYCNLTFMYFLGVEGVLLWSRNGFELQDLHPSESQ